MFKASGRSYLINPQMVAASYPVASLACECLILSNGKKYNATDIKEVFIQMSDGEYFNEAEIYSTGDKLL